MYQVSFWYLSNHSNYLTLLKDMFKCFAMSNIIVCMTKCAWGNPKPLMAVLEGMLVLHKYPVDW